MAAVCREKKFAEGPLGPLRSEFFLSQFLVGVEASNSLELCNGLRWQLASITIVSSDFENRSAVCAGGRTRHGRRG